MGRHLPSQSLLGKLRRLAWASSSLPSADLVWKREVKKESSVLLFFKEIQNLEVCSTSAKVREK